MMASGGSGGAGSVEEDKDAKHVLDEFGQQVYKEKVEKDAKNYIDDLKGNLQEASGSGGELAAFPVPCGLIKDKHENLIGDRGHPCGNTTGKEEVKRFSDTLGGQCTDHRIKGNDRNVTGGACAPLRRLHLCDKNMEKMDANNNDGKAKDNLLLEVCMAAYYEGQSIKDDHAQYQAKYNDFRTNICTELARSFADIGDIIRGKDLYLGYDDEEKNRRKQLENNLKEIFGNIYEELIKNGRNGKLQTRYNDTDKNYYKLREDWWEANRETVWKALTCEVGGGTYFRKTCNDTGQGPSQTHNKCRCEGANVVPTFFDYVPQYLRWFEEWAEDFCRKRKHKLENAIQKCRYNENGEEKYCSGNGFDCTQTIRGNEHFVEKDCHDCLVACSPFVKWLDNQKLEFLKQKRKYTSEIKKYTKEISRGTGGSKRKKRSTKSETYEGYDKDFYNILKGDYKDVKKFLNILNKEGICKEQPKVKGETADSIDFKNENTGKTFSRSKYCEPCPWCGAERKSDGVWIAKDDKTCESAKTKTYHPENITNIPILTPEEGQSRILKKYKTFCGNGKNGEKGKKGDQIETWKCYYDKEKTSGQNNNCVQGDWGKYEKDQKVMSYNAFFWYWVYHMLHDSLDWRNEHGNCINKKQQSECIPACKKTCDCFQKWVVQKKTEWEEVKKHFDKQKDIVEQQGLLGDGIKSPDFVLKYVLKLDELLKNIKDTHANADDIERIDKMLKEEENQVTGVGVGTGVGGGVAAGGNGAKGKHNTKIDKLLNLEEKEAEKCKNCDKKPPAGEEGGVARSDSGSQPPATGDNGHHSEDSEEEEEDEDEVEEDEEIEEVKEKTEEKKEEGSSTTGDTKQDGSAPPPAPTTDDVNVCETVKNALNNKENLNAACTLKYGKTAPTSSKCISETTTGGEPTGKSDTGSICVPPRRRRLYVGKLHDWASGGNTQEDGKAQTQGDNKTASDKLREAFIQSAAVETFFLWHQYKTVKQKELDEKKKQQRENVLSLHNGDTISGEQNPEKLLQSGNIPPDFLRQMFYTLGDYRDILFSGSNDTTSVSKDTPSSSSNDNLKNIVIEASGNTEEGRKEMQTIQTAISSYFSNSGKPENSVKTPSTSGTTPQQTWWENNGKYIWHGMVCALTYEDSGPKGQTSITQDTNLKSALLDENNKPKSKTKSDQNYTYEGVKLEENSGTSPKPQSTSTSGENKPTTLTDFISRPTYFRYLEEWGQHFCKERKKRLEKIKVDCEVDENSGSSRRGGTTKQKYSGDGEACDRTDTTNGVFADLEGRSCSISCSSYRKWIRRKKYEFTEQKSAYGKQKQKYEEEKKTFKHTEYCDPCSEFKLDCRNGKCSGDGTNVKCKDKKTITANDIETMGQPTVDVSMLVSDNFTTKFEGDGLKACQNAGIFKGFRKDEWKCGNVCGYNVCKPKKVDGETFEGQANGENQIIFIRALFKRWLEYFLQDYNKIKHKISHCINNGNGSICTSDCGKKCDCVGKWIEIKKKEWEEIKKRYLEQHKVTQSQVFEVKSFLQQGMFTYDVDKAIKPCGSLDAFEKSKECAVAANSEKENGKKRDVVVCLIEKLEEKAKNCPGKPSGENPENQCEQPPPLPDEEYENEDENEKTNIQPKFCPKPPEPEPEPVDEGGCDPASPVPAAPAAPTADSDDKSEKEVPQKPAPAAPPSTPTEPKPPKPPKPRPKPPKIVDKTPALVTSTLAWSVGIGFAAFTYFFLKKKTKSSVGNLFQILQIPKSDYDIPTKLSPNRYIPYTSGKYRGKRYIYLEGDSGTDSGYTDHYSDITSSSESEYEELDINDIYVPHAPKYKTLIEVVLEPSGKLSGNTIPTSGNNTTASDTQNDIQNDGIPSNKFSDNEWNQLKHDFITNMLQNQPNDVPNDYSSGDIPLNTQPNTLYFNKPDEKPFIMSIHDRNLLSGEEINYNINMSTNSMDDPKYESNNVYSGIDLINDSLSGDYDIYDELLKRKENELFGTEHHPKRTTTNHFATPARDDPIHNQLELFHKWLDRHRDMCEKWNNKEELLDKLKEEWNKDNNNNSGTPSDNTTPTSDIPSGKLSDIPSDNNIPSSNQILNTDVSIQIHMDNPKPINQFTNMDTILEDLDKPFNEPYYYDMYDDDIYYDVHDHDVSTVNPNNMDIPSKVQIEMDVNTKLVKEKYPIADVWDI
ncbi:erythrocyte membrane protein 1 [Plasmodium falciparum IGH-CR14]|uniref:Erythrocyte membrane protein 1 n=1 Tax=Plasmodium falciparum IGH-CR14 TaxID=580059 RepID=A0A0L1I726_PLAFA|nr:erythrocyte membrane protein 1 [Plasmodium falciparum IGH-CR14]